jgi:hypothetical protein
VTGLWSVVLVVILLLMEVVFGWDASARSRGFQLIGSETSKRPGNSN